MHNSTHNRNILGTLGNCKHRNVNKFTFCNVIAVELGCIKAKNVIIPASVVQVAYSLFQQKRHCRLKDTILTGFKKKSRQ